MVKLVNRAKMTTSTTGTGTITLGSAVDGFQTFTAAGVANGDTVRYCIEDGTSSFELGSGVFTASGTTLTRVVSESSNSNNAISLSGDAIVFITAIAADIQPTTFTTTVFTATANQTTFSVSYTVGFAEVFLNGSKLSAADFTATNGTSIVLASGAAAGDTVDVVAYATQTIANVYTQSQSDARFLQLTGGTLTGDLTGTTSTFSGDVTIADKIVHSGDTNTAIRFPAVDTVTVETNGSERLRVNSSGNILIPDNGKVIFGAGSDLNIYHDTNHSILEETGTGALKLKGDDIRLEDASGNNIVKAVGSGSAELYEAGTKKLETTSDGVDITGNIVRITGTSPMTYFMESGVTDSNHRIRQNSGNLVFQKLSDDEGTATDRMLIDGGTGNVGIGTTSPDALLHVAGRSKIQTVIEDGHVDTGTSGTTNIDFANTVAVYYFVNNQVGNAQLNFRGSGSQTLNALLSVGDAATATVAYTQGSTAYYINQVQIDGSNVTPKWSGGSAPTGGNASGIDVYSFSIIKTADATFTVFASVTQFA